MGAKGSTRWGAQQVRPGSRRCLEPHTVPMAAETTTCPSADRCALDLGGQGAVPRDTISDWQIPLLFHLNLVIVQI